MSTHRDPVTREFRREARKRIRIAEENLRIAKTAVDLRGDKDALKFMTKARNAMKDASWYLRGRPTRDGGRA